eukprot:8687402-Pyramimonas_sp.AAC.1
MEYGLRKPTVDRREIPPPRHNIPCLEQHFGSWNHPWMIKTLLSETNSIRRSRAPRHSTVRVHAHQPAPEATPAAKAYPVAYSPKPLQQAQIAQISGSESASASSAQQPLAPTPGAAPAGLAAVTAALIHSAEEFADPNTFDEEAI